jgi:hypothetical protein
MLGWWFRLLCNETSSSICLGFRRPIRKAWSLFMNLIAMTGPGAVLGMALRMLLESQMVSVRRSQCACRQEDVRCVGARADGLGHKAKGEVAG